MVIEPHDLIQISSPMELINNDQPKWVQEIFPKSLTVVVRRSPFVEEWIPVGIRGIKREQRFATYVSTSAIQKVITPYQLVREGSWVDLGAERKKLPAMSALPGISKILSGYNWGISGSVGFELATRTNTAKVTSDLDLIWKVEKPISKSSAQALLKKLNMFGVHADLQVIQGTNGFSLEEYANSRSTIMVKTLKEPILVHDPWIDSNRVER